jgi:glutamate-1-semialdehyde 2,1-aminomutase
LRENLRTLGIDGCVNRVGSMMSLFFTRGRVTRLSEGLASDAGMFKRYFAAMLASGIYLAPSAFEAAFVSAAHSEADIEATITASYESLRRAR